MNLKSFHQSGSGRTVTGGLARIKELLGVSKNIATPTMEIIVEDAYKNNKLTASKIASHLRYTTLQDIVDTVDIYYDPDPFAESSALLVMERQMSLVLTGAQVGVPDWD